MSGLGIGIVVIHYRARGTVDIGKMFIWSRGGKKRNETV